MLSDSDIRDRLGPLTSPDPTPDQSPRRRAGSLTAALAILVVLLWGGGIALILHLERISPRVPHPQTGQVHPFSDTRYTLYLTAKQRDLAWTGVGIPILATLALAFFATRKPPSPEP